MKKTPLLLSASGALLIAVVAYQLGSNSASTPTKQPSTHSENSTSVEEASNIPKVAAGVEPAAIELDPLE